MSKEGKLLLPMTDPNEQFVVVIKEDDAADLRKSLLQTHSDDGFLSSRTSDTKHGTSFARTCLNLSNAISGTLSLSLFSGLCSPSFVSLVISASSSPSFNLLLRI